MQESWALGSGSIYDKIVSSKWKAMPMFLQGFGNTLSYSEMTVAK